MIVLAALVGLWGGVRLYWRAQIGREVAAIKAGGWPVSMEEVNRSYAIPEGAENAADLYLTAFDRMVPGSEDLPVVGNVGLPGPHAHLDPNTAAAVAAYLAENKESLELLWRAASVEHSRYPFDLGANLQPLYGCLRQARQAAFMLRLEAYWHVDRGEAEPATQAIESLMAMASSIEDVPLLAADQTGGVIRAYALSSLADFLARTTCSDVQLQRLAHRLAAVRAGTQGRQVRALAAQRASTLAQLTGPRASRYEERYPNLHPDLVGPFVFFGLADRDAARALEVCRGSIEMAGAPGRHFVRMPQQPGGNPSQFQGLSAVAESQHRYLTLYTGAIAWVEAARVAVALERFRLANADVPEDLPALVPRYLDAVPDDPYDGSPLRYRRRAEGYVVYSVGDDLMDDHGTPREKADGPGDIVFRVER
jgi:hypothetical protein